MIRFTIFYEHDGGGTDWCALYAESDREARRRFSERYDGRRILRVEADKGWPEGWG